MKVILAVFAAVAAAGSTVSASQLRGRSLLNSRVASHLGTQVQGCKTKLTLTISNTLPYELEATYWTGAYGSIDIGGKKYGSTKKKSAVTVADGGMDMKQGYTQTVDAYNSDAGGNGVCNGAEGMIVLRPKEGTGAAGDGNALREVIVWYKHKGGSNTPEFDVDYVLGDYSDDQASQFKAVGAASCSYDGKVRSYYTTSLSSCTSANDYSDTNANQVRCGTNFDYRWNACPTSGSTASYSHTVTGTDSNTRTPSNTITLTYSAPPPSPITFENYTGYWISVGQGLASQSLSVGASWSTEESQEYSNSWNQGIVLSSEEEAGVVFAKVKLTQQISSQYERTSSQTLSETSGGSITQTCTSLSCTDGTLFQWALKAKAVQDGVDLGPSFEQHVTDCSFVCVPNSDSQQTAPMCPSTFCGNEACSCCKAAYIDGNNDPVANNLCPGVSA